MAGRNGSLRGQSLSDLIEIRAGLKHPMLKAVPWRERDWHSVGPIREMESILSQRVAWDRDDAT